jgi:hypothetical protein
MISPAPCASGAVEAAVMPADDDGGNDLIGD